MILFLCFFSLFSYAFDMKDGDHVPQKNYVKEFVKKDPLNNFTYQILMDSKIAFEKNRDDGGKKQFYKEIRGTWNAFNLDEISKKEKKEILQIILYVYPQYLTSRHFEIADTLGLTEKSIWDKSEKWFGSILTKCLKICLGTFMVSVVAVVPTVAALPTAHYNCNSLTDAKAHYTDSNCYHNPTQGKDWCEVMSSIAHYPFCPSDPCENPTLLFDIRAGWQEVLDCTNKTGIPRETCEISYLKELPNYAFHPKFLNCLYKEIVFIGKGAENRVYNVTLNTPSYNTTNIALRAFVKSTGGYFDYSVKYNEYVIPRHLTALAMVRNLSTATLNIEDFYTQIYGVYYGSLPFDIEQIYLYAGTDINAGVIPEGFYKSYFLRGRQTGHIPQGVKIKYLPPTPPGSGISDYALPILPVLYTEMELVRGGSLASLSTIPDDTVIEVYFMEYALLNKGIVNTDPRLENAGLQIVDYWRAYYMNDAIYLLKGNKAPKILDLDSAKFQPSYTWKYLSHIVDGGRSWLQTKVSQKSLNIIDTIKKNSLFSKEASRYLVNYVVSEEDLKNIEQNGQKIKHYYLTTHY